MANNERNRKSPAEYQREYRKRLQSKLSSGIISTKNCASSNDSAKRRIAEYYRQYRAKKKAELDKILHNTRTFLALKQKKTSAQYQREYRARKKAAKIQQIEHEMRQCMKSANIDSRTVLHLSASDASSVVAGSFVNTDLSNIKVEIPRSAKKRKSPAEYQRDYRARQKAKYKAVLACFTGNDSCTVSASNTTVVPSPSFGATADSPIDLNMFTSELIIKTEEEDEPF